MRKNDETIKLGDYVFHRKEKKEDKDSRHKLAPIGEKLYLVTQTDEKSKTVLIEYADKTVEKFSRPQVVRTPRWQTPAELQVVLKPTITEAIFVAYRFTDAANNSHAPDTEENDQPKIQEPEKPTSARTSERNDEFVRAQSKKLRTSDQTDENYGKAGLDEFVIDNIVSNKINLSKLHAHAKLSEVLYRVRCHGYFRLENTWGRS